MVWRRDFSLRGAKDEGFGQVVAWDVDLLSGYPSRFVGPRWREIAPFGAISSFVPAVFSEIRRGGYDAVWVDGHVAAANFMAVAAAKAVGAPVLMRSETHLGLRRSRLKGALRKPALSALYALCDGFLAIGSQSGLLCCDGRSVPGATQIPLWETLPVFFRNAAEPIRVWLQSPDVIEICANRPREM
jgi:hypothetical protein